MLFLSLCIGQAMKLCKHLNVGRIVSINGFNLYLCFFDFMVHFTNFMLFLSPYIGYSHETLQTLTSRQDCFSSIFHECIQTIVCFFSLTL